MPRSDASKAATGVAGERRDDASALGRRDDRVAMGHPDGLLRRRVVEEPRLFDAHLRPPELGDAGAVDAAAELERHQLRAVTDAERRDPELEQRRIDPRRVVGVDRRRPAAEDERVRVARAHGLGRDRVTDELRVDAALADAPRDQLRVLPAEVDDENRPVLRAGNCRTCASSAAIVRRLFRDRHVVRVRLAQPRRRDADEARPLHLLDRRGAAVAHRLAQRRRRAGGRPGRAAPL